MHCFCGIILAPRRSIGPPPSCGKRGNNIKRSRACRLHFRTCCTSRKRTALLFDCQTSFSMARRVREQIVILHRRLPAIVRDDEVCRRLMTTPGVGLVVALTYRATVDVPARFRKSKAVGAVIGLTCQSGEIDRNGRISRCGDEMMRVMLHFLARYSRSEHQGGMSSLGVKIRKGAHHEVRLVGVRHQWRKEPPGELSIAPAADGRLGWATSRLKPRDKGRLGRSSNVACPATSIARPHAY